MNIKLPKLQSYKDAMIAKGIKLPLNTITKNSSGLLKILPMPSNTATGWPWKDETTVQIYNQHTTWPKITIVTPSYNQGQFIEETIRAVLLQNYPNLEYIIIDGGSTDGTKEILEKYSPWISYWQSEKDNGQSHAINLGFSLASGDYLAWINSDDYYLKDTLYKVVSTFIETKVSFVYGYALNFEGPEKGFELIKTAPLLDYFLRLPALAQPSCFWSKKIHQPLWEELQCSLDFELWQRLVKGNKRKLIKEPLSVANIHADAKTSDPKMGSAWAKDHELICNADAHGPVKNWGTIVFLNRIWIKIHTWLN